VNLREEKDIINQWEKNKNENPLVSIVCHTYNQENYIEDTIQGFLKQKTKFPFEVIIHDDASLDGTKKIVASYVEKYPKILKPIYQEENQFSKRNISASFTYPASKGKYIAHCEGDDYWIDEYKLQKQVDFLEQNEDYVVTWTNLMFRDGDKLMDTGFDKMFSEVYTIDFNNLFEVYNTYTLTVLFRKDAIEYHKILELDYAKDNTIYALLIKNGKGAFLNFVSAVYRWHDGGVFSLKSNFFKRYSSFLNVKEIYDKIEGAKTKNIEFIYKDLLRQSAEEGVKLFWKNDKIEKEARKAVIQYLKESNFKEKKKFIKLFFKLRKS
jgi:glycosyltransferase involved in cell wall biosynthesis